MLTLWNQPNGLFRTREFEDFFRDFGGRTSKDSVSAVAPRADIHETKNEFVVDVDLPGMKKEDIEVSVDEGVLTIKAERKYEKNSDTDVAHRTERYYGVQTRSFQLPTGVDASKTKADYTDGALTVTLPKMEEVKPKAIKVN